MCVVLICPQGPAARAVGASDGIWIVSPHLKALARPAPSSHNPCDACMARHGRMCFEEHKQASGHRALEKLRAMLLPDS